MTQEARPSDMQLVLETLRHMPNEATLEEISETIAILAALRKAETRIESGHFVSHEEALRRSTTWTT